MKKRLFILAVTLVSMTLWGCSQNDDSLKDKLEENAQEDITDDEGADYEADGEEAVKKAYVRAIKEFYDDHVLPDGTDVTGDISDIGPFSDNSFAVYDIDGDGEEELDIRFVSTATTAALECIYGYDKETGRLYEKLTGYPSMQYYTYGFMKQLDSHNQGVSGDFWPYYLIRYDNEKDSFEYVAYVEAWDGNSYPKDMDGNRFPAKYDKDGDGFIFYLTECEEPYDHLTDTPLDYNELRSWLYENMSYTDSATGLEYMAERIYLPFHGFFEEDISAYEESEHIQTDVDPAEFTKFTLKDMTFWLADEYLDKVTVEEDDDSYTFYHTRSMEAMREEYPDEDFKGGYLFSICALKDSDSVYDSESYVYYGSAPTSDDGTDYYHYFAFRPTDMPGAGGNDSISEYLEMEYMCNHIYEEIEGIVEIDDNPVLGIGEAEESDAAEDSSTPDKGSGDKEEMKEAYLGAAKTFLKDHILPDGKDLSEDIAEFSTFDENRFAIYDVDGDEEEELVILFTSTYHAGYVGYIYGYDGRTGDLYKEFSGYPVIDFYSHGCLKEMDSSNQGVSGSLTPYTLHRYDADRKKYEALGHVSAWDGNQYPEDMNGKKFPAKYDKDGDGMIYYVTSCEPPYSDILDNPVDYEELSAWLFENMKYTIPGTKYEDMAAKISVPFRYVTKENIAEYEDSDLFVTLPDPDEFTRFDIKDMTFWLPNSFMEKVVVKGGGDYYTFYHKRSLDKYREEYPDDEYPGGYLFRICALDDDAEVYSSESFHYYGSSPSDDGKTKYYNYVAFMPTDVQYYEGDKECAREYVEIQYQCEDVQEQIKNGVRFSRLPNFVD